MTQTKQIKEFKDGQLVYIHAERKKGVVKGRTRSIPTKFLVEVIVNFDKETQQRTTRLLTLDVSEIDVYREKKSNFQSKQHSKDTLFFAKVKPNAIIPTKRLEDGCYDIYVCVEEDEITIKPHEIVTIPTGIASAFSHKYRLDFQRERGSTGSIGLSPRCGQVDSGYRGEIFLKMQNTTDKTIYISNSVTNITEVNDYEIVYPMSKAICQVALEIVPVIDVKEISYEELSKIPSERGNGALGSSGK